MQSIVFSYLWLYIGLEIQEKLTRRQLVVENRMNEPKWMSQNKTIMDYAIQYVRAEGLKEEILASINQVGNYKRMLLPCELVGLSRNKTTKEMREKVARSCIKWKYKFDIVPKPSSKSYEI